MLNLVERVVEAKKLKIKNYPCHVNRASSMGHPCERFLYYSRANWKDRALVDVELQFIFDMGNLIEDEAASELKQAGFLILEQQRPFSWEKYQITGHLDFKVAEPGSQDTYPIEVKGLAHYEYQKLNSIGDFFASKKHYVRGYPAQLMLYMIMDNKHEGAFYLKSKQSGFPKEVWITLDYEYAETLVKKAERVNWAVQSQTPPDRIEYDETICGRCPFMTICLADINYGPGTEILDNDELLVWLKQRDELRPLAKKYDEVDEAIKLAVKERPSLIIGNYLITGKWQERNKKKFWKVTIINKDLKPQIGEE